MWFVLSVASTFWPYYAVYLPGYEWHLYFFGYLTVVFGTHFMNFAVYEAIDFYDVFPQNKIVKVNVSEMVGQSALGG